MRAKAIGVLYYGGYSPEAALIIRQAREHGYELQLVAGDGISNEDFGLSPASDGTLMTYPPNPANTQAVEPIYYTFRDHSCTSIEANRLVIPASCVCQARRFTLPPAIWARRRQLGSGGT